MRGFAERLALLAALSIEHDFYAPVTFAALGCGVGSDRIGISPALGAQPRSIPNAGRQHRRGSFCARRRKLDVRWEGNCADRLIVRIADDPNRALLLLQRKADANHQRLEARVYRPAAR